MHTKRLLPILPVLAAFAVFAPSASAATTTDCDGLQTALDNSSEGDTIVLQDDHLCTGSFSLPNHAITLTGGGAPRSNGFDGEGKNQSLEGSDVGATTVANLLFRNGNDDEGAALYVDGNSPVTLSNNEFVDNVSDDRGGAVYISDEGANTTFRVNPAVTLENNLFGGPEDGNTAGEAEAGGGAYVFTTDDLNVLNNTFANNSAPGGAGGGLDAHGLGTTNLSGNDFSENSAGSQGGGARVELCPGSTVANNRFADNFLELGDTDSDDNEVRGAGLNLNTCESIFVRSNKTRQGGSDAVDQSGNRFTDNSIEERNDGHSGEGGGEAIFDLPVESTNDRFVGNEIHTPSGEGGGLAADSQFGFDHPFEGRNLVSSGNTLTAVLDKSITAQESATGFGGGIYFGSAQFGDNLLLFDSTVTANEANVAAGIEGDPCDELTLDNSIVTHNTGSEDVDITGFNADGECRQPDKSARVAANPGTRDIRFSDVCDDSAPAEGPGNICADPLLVDPANGDVHQTGSSPGLNKGSNALVPSDLTKDWEGQARIAGPAVDMGADETPVVTSQPKPPTPPAAPGCLNGGGNVHGKTLGPAKLGRGQTSQREIFKGAKLRTRKGLDKYCAIPKGWFRIGYPNARLFKPYGRSLRKATSKRVVLILTSSPRFKLLGLKRGTKQSKVRSTLKHEHSFVIGANRWYVVRTTGKRVLLVKVQTGLVREIGLGDGRFAKTDKRLRAYLRAWEGGL
jgi:hypothetical protein